MSAKWRNWLPGVILAVAGFCILGLSIVAVYRSSQPERTTTVTIHNDLPYTVQLGECSDTTFIMGSNGECVEYSMLDRVFVEPGEYATLTVGLHDVQIVMKDDGNVRLGCLHYQFDDSNADSVVYINASEYRPCLDQTPAVPVPFR